MTTRDILNAEDVKIGELTLPDGTSEDEWTAKLAAYRYVCTGPAEPIPTEYTAVSDTSSTSSTDVGIDSMSCTPEPGTHMVVFSTSIETTDPGAEAFVSIYVGDTQVAASEKKVTFPDLGILTIPVLTQTQVSVDGSQVVTARWRTSAGTVTAHQRILSLVRVA